MEEFSLKERILIPSYDDPNQISPGEVAFDSEKCTGCSMCMKICPADSIEMEDKKSRLKPPGKNECMFCGACMAVCPEGVITLTKPYRYTLFFKTIGQGETEPPRL